MILHDQDLTVSVCLCGVDERRDVQTFKRVTWFERIKKIPRCVLTMIMCRPICCWTRILKNKTKNICSVPIVLDFLNVKNMYMKYFSLNL